jgi:hypothetical protein
VTVTSWIVSASNAFSVSLSAGLARPSSDPELNPSHLWAQSDQNDRCKTKFGKLAATIVGIVNKNAARRARDYAGGSSQPCALRNKATTSQQTGLQNGF